MEQLVPHPVNHIDPWQACPCEVCVMRREADGHLCVIEFPIADGDPYEIFCERCEYVGEADTMVEADAIRVLHERFVAALVATWSFDE